MATGSDEATIYRAAVIGVGNHFESLRKGGGHRIGYVHGQMYRQNDRSEIVAAADISDINLRTWVKHFEVPGGFLDYRQMLKEARPDIVSICTYVGTHYPMIVDCARAGVKAVFCEKPFVCSPVELQGVRDIITETGLKLVISHVRRYRPAFMRVRELFRQGAIGKPMLCTAGIADWDLSEWGSHWLDIFRYFHQDQPVKWVLGQARVRDQRGYNHAMEEHAVAYFGFEDGGRGLLDGGCALNGEATMTLLGTEGTIRVLGENKLVIDTASGRKVEEFTDPSSVDWFPIWPLCLQDLVAWLDGKEEPRIGFTYTGPTAELNLAAYISAVRGDRIDLPLTDDLNEWPVEVLARRAGG
jgi:predicted dehydrogenase